MKIKTHYQRVASQKNMWLAWQAVKDNGRTSQSAEIQGEIRHFDHDAIRGIQSIVGRLSKKSFTFPKAKGIPKRKPGKTSRRGIVLAPLESRIVQRSILQVIQEDPSLKFLFDNPNSFGGLKEKGVRHAVQKAQSLIRDKNCSFFICSDISGFFDHVRPKIVVDEIRKNVSDNEFISLLEDALVVELSNISSLKQHADLFPTREIGVAQGCCLSPLIGNIYLKGFDEQLNTDDVFCLRYIDDFIILGPNEKAVRAKFKAAQKILTSLGLSVYDPKKNSDKASEGETAKGFDYLGCFVSPKIIRPSAKSWKKLKDATEESFKSALESTANPAEAIGRGKTFSSAVRTVNLRLEGWIKQYKFTTDERVVAQWNSHLREKFLEFENHYFKLLSDLSLSERANLLGFFDIDFNFRELRNPKTAS